MFESLEKGGFKLKNQTQITNLSSFFNFVEEVTIKASLILPQCI